MLDHKHLIITAKVMNPPKSVSQIKLWMKKLIADIDMEVLMGPYAVYSKMEGNRGLTAAAIINTSHIVLHSWDEESPGLIQLDIFSCKDFDIDIAFDSLDDFVPISLDYSFLDRNGARISKVKRNWFSIGYKRLNEYLNKY